MASISETTAVALRRGNKIDNDSFTGVQGELVVSLGEDGTGTDISTELRLHNGITQGGIPIANASMVNVSTKSLARNRALVGDKNLAYADLSNFETLSDSTAISTIVNALDTYGMATDEELEAGLFLKANKNMDNVLTSTLATERGEGENGNLAYTDFSNANTKYLATNATRTGEDGDLPLAYYDVQNVNTTNLTLDPANRPNTMSGPTLARKDLTNVNTATWNDLFFSSAKPYNLETTRNKQTVLSPGSISDVNYPTTGAVVTYVTDQIDNIEFEKQDFSNTLDWTALYTDPSVTSELKFKTSLANGGTGYITGYHLLPIEEESAVSTEIPLQIIVDSINSQNKPTSVSLIPAFGNSDLRGNSYSFKNSEGDTVTVSITANVYPITSEANYYQYIATVTASSVSHSGFSVGGIYACTTAAKAYPLNAINITQVDTNGAIVDYVLAPYVKAFEIESSRTVDITHNSGETGSVAQLNIDSTNPIPAIGGAGLLKTNLNNLAGMTEEDIAATNSYPLSINPKKPIPAQTASNIASSEYGRLATVGQVWDAIQSTDTIITFRKWS